MSGFFEIAEMSAAFVTDQKSPPSAVVQWSTGASARIRANSSWGGPSANRSSSIRSTWASAVSAAIVLIGLLSRSQEVPLPGVHAPEMARSK